MTMMNRVFFSAVAAASALVASAALAAGQHSGGDAHRMQEQPMQHGGPHGHDERHRDSHAGTNGRPGDPAKVSRVIDMTMDDTMRFTPERITVQAGETVRFFLKNTGVLPHEFVIGSMDELLEHAEMMRRMSGVQHEHEEPNQITLAPRQIGGVVWQFDRPGTVDFACLIPGHFEAGMVGKVQVDQ